MEEDTLVLFGRDFDWCEPGSRFTIAYKAGMCVEVPQACADKAFANGAAVPAEDDPLWVPTADEVLTPIIESDVALDGDI